MKNNIETIYKETNGSAKKEMFLLKQNNKVEKISIIAKRALNKKIHFNSLLIFFLIENKIN
ncbi:MAG: hypothetical protein KAJ62_11625 [Desulfobacteraceae bacterium]|nr:hypothetical protein [Desulfobacteraceae bacterium]